MRTVEVTAELDAAPEEIFEELSPESILEYERTYDVETVTRTDDGWLVTATSVEPDFEMKLAFEKRSDGYVYELIDGGPFEELSTRVTVYPDGGGASTPADVDDATADEAATDETATDEITADEAVANETVANEETAGGTNATPERPVRVTMRSTFTFGGWLSPVVDRFAESDREAELERALVALAAELGALDASQAVDSDDGAG